MEDSNGEANGDTTLYSVIESVCFKGTVYPEINILFSFTHIPSDTNINAILNVFSPQSKLLVFAIFQVFQSHKIALRG